MRVTPLVLAASLLFVPVAFLSFARWSVDAPAVPQSKLEKLRIGMTQAEVLQLLGAPRKGTSAVRTYGSRWQWYFLKVTFDREGIVESFVHDD